MANLGNAWHIPEDPEPRGRAGMRDPVGAIVPGALVTILSGNQYQGAGNPGNQLQDGSAVLVKRQGDADWTTLPMQFSSAAGNNKYYSADLPADVFQTEDTVEYYVRIAYDDHDTTFLHHGEAGSVPAANEAAAQASPFSFTVESSAVRGHWGQAFPLPNVAIHSHLLPDGNVLFWGRRDHPDQSLDVHECTPHVWNPTTGALSQTPQPTLADGTKLNLFCSGHTLLRDGRLLVVGGHLADSEGLNQSCVYDPVDNIWTASTVMNDGRWYPTAVTLPDGSVIVLSGSFLQNGQKPNNLLPQVWRDGSWTTLSPFPDGGTFELYPRVHVASDGQVILSGPLAKTWSLNVAGGGQWTTNSRRDNARRDYCPSVTYDVDKIVYIGGGNDPGTHVPTANTELLDLTQNPPRWQATRPMNFPRRQHNGTILPDGTVLVTGGTRGGGGPGPNPMGFDDLSPGQPVHIAELWDPATGEWNELAAETVDRCYHSTAVLLPDATILSAGGGEYRPIDGRVDIENDSQDSHRDAQIFSPPYIFKGPQPEITAAPGSVDYGETFAVSTPQASEIAKASFVRLSSVTHSFNANQRINFLAFQVDGNTLKLTAPPSAEVCPPGHYMLFILSTEGVPSVAKIIHVGGDSAPAVAAADAATSSAGKPLTDAVAPLNAVAQQAAVHATATGARAVIGITGTCPYGIGACWGGAHEALLTLSGVEAVDPIPNAEESTATVFLSDHQLPDLDQWQQQFTKVVNGSYELRGVEVTLEGLVATQDAGLVLKGDGVAQNVQLEPIAALDKVQWDRPAGAPEALAPDEADAYDRLAGKAGTGQDRQRATITGPLKQVDTGYKLQVRWFAT